MAGHVGKAYIIDIGVVFFNLNVNYTHILSSYGILACAKINAIKPFYETNH